MNLTRRRFIAGLGVVAIAAAAGGLWMRRAALRRWLFAPPLAGARPGPLRDSTADVLAATVLALLDGRVEAAHYVDLFRWRAEHVSGARRLYERFESTVDHAAWRQGHAGFRAAPRAAQRAILGAMMPESGRRRVMRALIARDEERFARYVVREVFRRFAWTDAWIIAGYDAWPGMPRAIATLGRGGPWV
jgi:hypothetical protein